ncbi:serine/threonine-protein kinase [Myxococcus sp. MxC21-1]|uniref:protein kinase domain-containing protein n=1 Tax=Myxococcus sp. MxC21-1 TaxID=3041439 RepID=UPI002B3210F1|nr:serine/threonine-protein kinase [Myxococcus sp. MxC21-1]
MLEQVGGALRTAHQAGVVHRDLKAQNVVRLSTGGGAPRVKLVDFGVAKGLTPDAPGASTLTLTGVSLGTPLSMAPEQIRGEPPDARTDLYAMGVLLFQLITGQPPFQGATRHEVEDLHLNAPPPRPSERAPVPAALDAVVLRSMGKRREDRYPDIDAWLDALRRAVKGSPTEDQPTLAVALYAEARLHGAVEPSSLERLDALLERVGGPRAPRGWTCGWRGAVACWPSRRCRRKQGRSRPRERECCTPRWPWWSSWRRARRRARWTWPSPFTSRSCLARTAAAGCCTCRAGSRSHQERTWWRPRVRSRAWKRPSWRHPCPPRDWGAGASAARGEAHGLMPWRRSRRYRWTRSMPAVTAAWATLPWCFSSSARR